MFDIGTINWLAIFLAWILVSFLGWFWFVILFGKAYANALGRLFEPNKKPSPLFIFGPSICCLITTIASSILFYTCKIDSLSNALIFGLITGAGLVAPTAFNMAINPNIPRIFVYGVMSGSFFILQNIIISIVLFVMG